jgi:excisionase family DNA binding protein
MQLSAMENLLSASEMILVLRVSRRTFEAIVARNEAPPYLRIGRQRRWRQSDVTTWFNTLATDAARQSEKLKIKGTEMD